jgi:Tfp pilus assembly major pilin PilA
MRNKQQGVSFFSLMIILIVAGIFFAVGMKLFPVYWDHSLVTSMMEELVDEPETKKDSPAETRLKISKRLRINQVNLPVQNAITIDVKEGIKTLTLQYDVTVPMFYNVDAVVKFHEQYEVVVR